MDIEQQIEINEQLLRREEAFMQIHCIEKEINRVLGCSYPLPPPPTHLPSCKRVKASRKKTPTKSAVADKKVKIRPLQTGETAYQVVYLHNGERCQELHRHHKTLEMMLNTQSTTGLTFVQIDVVSGPAESDSSGDHSIVETLYRQDAVSAS